MWTQRSYHCERIYRDDDLWEEMLPKAQHCFRVGVLPELLGKCHTRPPLASEASVNTDTVSVNTGEAGVNTDSASVISGEAAQTVWCYCRKEYGEMVACDSGSCVYEWFHYSCVGVLSEPKGKWFCHECRKDKRRR